uniref:Uncharacterized protein n=1 Tax=Cacopsylla melanoneura TaxID=428564 RepID=A0A8D9BSS0_9HEMI
MDPDNTDSIGFVNNIEPGLKESCSKSHLDNEIYFDANREQFQHFGNSELGMINNCSTAANITEWNLEDNSDIPNGSIDNLKDIGDSADSRINVQIKMNNNYCEHACKQKRMNQNCEYGCKNVHFEGIHCESTVQNGLESDEEKVKSDDDCEETGEGKTDISSLPIAPITSELLPISPSTSELLPTSPPISSEFLSISPTTSISPITSEFVLDNIQCVTNHFESHPNMKFPKRDLKYILKDTFREIAQTAISGYNINRLVFSLMYRVHHQESTQAVTPIPESLFSCTGYVSPVASLLLSLGKLLLWC